MMKRDKERFESLLAGWLDGTISESDRQLLLGIIGRDRGVEAWFETQIDGEQAPLDRETSRRMLERIHRVVERENRALKRLRTRALMVRISKAAAMIALPLTTAFATWRVMLPDVQSVPVEVIVERGEKASVVLPDGSKVWLNSDSRLSYSPDSWPDERSVSLVGEAYFEVQEDEKRPFTVTAGKFDVKVLGTRFNVKAYPEDRVTTSTLVEGSVEVTTPNGSYTIEPGWQVGYDAVDNVTTPPTQVDTAVQIAWIDNKLVFTDELLETIVTTVERMYNVEVVFASESIRSRRFSGTLPNAGLKEFLEVISLSSPISYVVKDGTVYLSEDSRRIELYR